MADSIDRLFGDLQSRGFAKDKTLTDFRNYMLAPGEQGYRNRKQFFDDFKSQGMTDLETYEDFAGLIGLQAGKPERVDTPSYQPSAEEMAGFQRTINSANRTATNPTQGYERKEQLMKKRQGLNVSQRVSLGESNNLTPTEQHLNPETGELEQGYMTSSGNEYDNKAIADMEQRQINKAERDEQYRRTLPGQLEDAYAERDRLNGELGKFQGQWIDQDGRVHYATREDEESVASLEAALRQNQQRITALEAERDDDGGTQFWRGFIDAAKNPSVQSFGLTDFDDMLQLMRIKSKIDHAQTTGQQPELTAAEQQLMESSYLNNYAQSAYGDNRGFMYRAGGISMQALPFVAEFMMTGGFSAISEKGAQLGVQAAEKLALEGLGKSLVKNLGVVAGDVAAGWAMANTTGLFRTVGDTMQRNVGQVAIDDEGNLGFEGGKSLGRSIYEAQVANTLEYYTEKLGEHLQIGKWLSKGAEKMGLGRLSKAVNYLSSSKWLERGGVQDYPSEVVEEQANLLLNAILVGDNNFSVNPESKDFDKSVFNPKTQLDIWGGMAFSIGLMQVPRLASTGYNALGYYTFKKGVDISDENAAIVFGRDNWNMIKEQIDNCDNEQLPALLETVVNGQMKPEQKTATMNYTGNLLKMRGYNMGMMADAKDEEKASTPEAAVSQSINQGYQAGRMSQVPDEMKSFVDEATAAGENLPQYGNAFARMVMESQNPNETMLYLLNRRDYFSDKQIGAAADYFQKQAKAQGVMDAAIDRVDVEVERANAEVRGNTHQQTGSVVMAKGEGDMDYYIIGGDIVTDPDTGMTSLAGTGGAVVVKDAVTGEVKVDSPQKYMMYSMQSADELIQQNETTLREQLMQQADDDITFGSPANEVYELEDTVTLNDGNGGTIEGTVVTMPNAIDGVYVVQTSDGRALQLTGDDLNRRIVAHNGQEVMRATQQPTAEIPQSTERQGQQQPQQSGTDNAAGETPAAATAGQSGASNDDGTAPGNQPQSALSRIPVRTDASGQPVKNKKGRPILDWHKASTEDAAEALIETTGGDLVMARDTASDLVRNEQARLEKIRKQKPKGEDPQEISESRMEIRRQEQEAQAIIKQWQDVGTHIRKRMEAEAAEKRAAEEAAKSEEQKAREAEAARIRQEQQEAVARERRRKQVEEEVANWNKPYAPLAKARKEMESDPEAMEILNRTDPETLEEWVSSLITPQSMMWDDETDPASGRTVIGLQSELGLQKKDIERIGGLVASRAKGGKPFGQVVHDIWEQLPEGMKNMYDDQDVRNALIGLFGEGNTMRMRHLTEEHRIEQARQTMEENRRRDREAEMDAWAEAYHLTPEERETFEDWLQLPPTEPEQEIINQIIADNEQNQASPAVGGQPDGGASAGTVEEGQGQVQAEGEAASDGNNAAEVAEAAEDGGNQPAPAGDVVSGGVSDKEALALFFEQIGAEPELAERMSDFEIEQLTALVDEWDAVNSEYGEAIEQRKDELKSKNKEVRDQAKAVVGFFERRANNAFEPVEQYVAELQAKYIPEEGGEFEGAIPNPAVDEPRYRAIRQALVEAYRNGDASAITAAAQAVQQYVDEGLNAPEDHTEIFDIAEEYEGNDPEKLADQYIIRTFWDRYLDDDADKEYIKTGLKPGMRQIAPSEQLKPTDLRDATRVESPEIGVAEANARVRGDNLIGRSLTEDEADDLILESAARAEQVPDMELTPENWQSEFGTGILTTPMGKVKLGENQYGKMVEKGRSKEFGMIKPTLTNPDFVIEVASEAKEGVAERPTSYLFVKAFIGKDGKKQYFFKSVTVQRDGMEVNVSNHFDRAKRLRESLKNGKLLYRFNGGAQTEQSPATVSVTTPQTKPGVENGSLNEPNGSTLSSPASSVGKDTNNSSNDQENQQKSAPFRVGGQFVDRNDNATILTITGIDGSEITYETERLGARLSPKTTSRKLFEKMVGDFFSPVQTTDNNFEKPIGPTSSPEQIAEEEEKVNTSPSEGQKEAGNYQKGHIKIDGYDITIENPKGSIRRGTDASGKPWETEMHNTYGYIRGTEGVDGDHIDVFLSDNPTGGSVFVVDQVNPSTGEFDEHKCMYGFGSEAEAREAYLSNYSKGWKGLGTITEVSREEFKKWVESSHRKTKPFAEYKNIRTVELPQSTEQSQKEKKPKAERQHKRIVSDEKMEELRRQLIEKMKNLNEGIDVERMLIGAMYAVGKIERGVTKFADYAREMVEEIGDSIRPYLKSFYNAVRDMPEAREYRDQMDSAEYVENFDEYNFDKQQSPDPITKAQQVVEKQKAKKSVKKVEKEVKQKITQGDLFAGDLFGDVATPQQAEQTKKDENLPKTAWWGDPNRPKSLNPKDYKTYTTDEAREYFANFMAPADEKGKVFPDFTKWAHPNLAYITAAAWDGAVIPLEELQQLPEIQEAEARKQRNEEVNGTLSLTNKEIDTHANHLLDAEHGSQVYKNGKKVKDDYSGLVRQERKALIVIGRPAGGKSSVFADRLSYENGARIVDSDVVKPWLEGFDEGYGAGVVHDASAAVADRALEIAVENGDNMIIPRIGGPSVISKLVIPLREKGYDVQLYFNEVSEQSSIMRAASRFAQEGRYLSLDYLTQIKGKDYKTFINFAEKNLGDFYDERDSKERPAGRTERPHDVLLEGRGGNRRTESSPGNGTGRSVSTMVQTGGELRLEPSGTQGNEQLADGERIFSYAEWKSNDVAFGEKPKEIWNSKSGKPMPGETKVKAKSNEGEQKVSGQPATGSQGATERGQSVDRPRKDGSTEPNRSERSGSGHSVDNTLGGKVGGAVQTRSGSTNTAARANGNARNAASPISNNNRRNNVGERGKDYAPLSPKARFNANVEAIRLMRQLVDDGVEVPNKEQMTVLRQYSGWGGMGTFFNDETSAENKLLHDLLSEEEYHDAALSIKSAYYTPAIVIDTLWDVAKALGFKGGNVLEGSAGIGNIIGQMPKDMSRQSDIEAVEIDPISGNILKLLYPDAKVHIQGFQDTVIPNGSVDLAITNVPFVTGMHVIDKVDKDLSRRFENIHDFCIAKNIRKLREGGLGIFISSNGTLDKSTKLREWITDEGQADVIGAFRLHNKTFGGAPVTSDIIVVRKRVNGQKSAMAIDISKASPMRVGTYEDKDGNEKQVTMTVNDYFHEHPEMMAGEMAFGYEKGAYRPGSYGLYPVEGKDQEKMLAGFVKRMQEVGAAIKSQPTEQPGGNAAGTVVEKNQLTAEKEGRMLVDGNGRLCVSQRGEAVPLALNATKVKGRTKQQCFEDYQTVQKAVDDVLQQQLNDPDDTALKPKLDALNKAFDSFVKRYGNLHKNTAIAFLRNDIDFPSFLALENYSESKDINGKVTVNTSKTPLFRQRVLGFKTEPQPKTVKDAVIASIFRTNGIDLEWITAKLNEVAAPPHGDKWTTEDVKKGILVSRLGFENPSTGQLEVRYKYLSGNVREKLAIAEGYNKDGKYSANVEVLRKVVPMDIPAHLIEFSLGSSWIPLDLYKQYLAEVYELTNVKLAHMEGAWMLDPQSGLRNEKNRAAGVYSEQFRATIYGHELVTAALNNRPVKVAKQVTEGYGSSKTTRTIVDQAATQACAVRVDEIKDEFKQWAKKKMQEEPELASTIEKLYNDKFNALVPMHIDDELLPEHFEDSNVNITLYGHQKRGVMRGVTAPTMLAHEVGTGKSFTLITTAMEMRRLGTARKPMIVVQNATVAQLTSDAKLLYPNAKILSLSEKDRSAEGRRSFYAKIKYNDWDIVIVPQSTFERIPDSPERELQFIQEKIDEKKHVIEAAAQAGVDERDLKRLQKELDDLEQEYGDKYLDNGDTIAANAKKKRKNAKDEAAAIENTKVKAQEQLDRAVDDVQYFDDLGVDALLVDEAHEYKHLGFQTSIGRGIKGIDPSYSKKCAGLYNKTRSVFEKAGWKNVVFATGTPISNTAAEIWTFMKYLMPADVMRQNDIYYFDDFVHNFGNISQMLEFATSGKFKENTRFAAYVNKPELIRIWSQVADTVLTKEVGAVNEKIPEMEGGKDQDVFLPQSPSLISIMAAVRAELERFEKMSGKEKRENSSIPLTMYGIAKRAAIDPRLVNPDAPDEPLSKTNAAVKEIVKDLESTKDYKGTVAVFCDNQNRLGTGKDGKKSVEFNIYDDMRDKLIAIGVPAEQIAIIKSGMSITAKQKIFDAVNAGDIRVVLGSTQTLGTGVNMQERLHLLIHMDAPDRPMDYTQRNGRIKRQGNLHKIWGKTIRVIRFGVEDSLDVTAYQRLKTKSGFIDSIMDGKGALLNNQVDRTVEEEEEGLFDNPVAVLSGSQYALKKNQAERELRKYQSKKAQWEADQVYVTSQLRRNKSYISSTQEDIKREQANLEHIKSLFPNGKVGVITIEGKKVDISGDKAAAYAELSKVLKEQVNDPVNATVKQLRENEIYNDQIIPIKVELDGHAINFEVSVEREAVYDNGKMRTVVHKYTTFKSADLREESHMKGSKGVKEILETMLDQIVTGRDYQDRIEAIQQKKERARQESEQLEKRVGLPFQFDKELAEAKQHVEEYTELMKKEMEEKEAKYAAQQAAGDAADTFDLHKAEDSEEDDDDGVRYRADEDTLSEHIIRVLDALEGEHPGFNDGFSVEPDFETGVAQLWVSNREAAMQLYKNEHPDAQGDYYFSTYMWARQLFEDKLRDPSLQPSEDDLPDFAVDAEQQRSRIIGTDSFKGFFGDWQNDAVNASKVIDPDGKPLILYHATNLTQVNKGKPFWTFYPGSHFGTVGQSKSIIREDDGITKTYPVYLNIRNPKRVSDTPAEWEETHSEWWEKQIANAKAQGYDGIVYLNRYEDKEHPADSWIAFYPEQVKSAQENVGTYDPTNPDIRHREGERFAEGQTFPIHTTEMQSSYNVLDRSRTYSTDLMPDEYGSEGLLLDALRNQYPDYYVSIEDGNVRMESWGHVFGTAQVAQSTRQSKATKNFVERKTRNAVNAVKDLARRLNLDVEVLTTTEGLTGKKARSKGWFNPKTGKITLVLPNNSNQHDLINTLLHEGVAHYGLRHLFGSHFEIFLDNVYNNVSPEIKARIDASVKRNKWGRHEATEEYLARLAERTDFEHAEQQGWWQKIKDFFIRMLGEAGFNTTLTDNELRYILWRSYDNLLHPDRRRTLFDKAREVDMQRRLGISRYARERERLQRTGRVDTSRVAAEAEPISVAEEYSDVELLHRDDDDWGDDIAQQTYEKAVASDVMKWVESWQDSMTSLKAIQDAIAAETGNVATGAEDAYHFENRMHGRAKNMSEQYNWQYYRPMLKAFSNLLKAKNMTQEQGLDYLISKSGLERNVYYAMRDAIKAKITDEIKEEREKLEKQYAKGRISEADYLTEKANLEERERTGVDDSIDQIRSTLAYQRAKEDYKQHLIGYTEYLRRIESLIRSHVARLHPKKDSSGNIVSDNYYDDYAKDYSGLTETFVKEMYDEAQKVKKRAQRAIDPQERRALWAEYDEQMRQAYQVARQLAEDAVFAAEDTAVLPQSTEPTVTDRLWKAINAATKETLRQSYESGLIDRKNYNKVRAMFDYYIPLRGWEEDKAADIYTYMGRENVFSPAVKKTWGRRSQAENPLAYIGNIAVSTILSGHRNQMKQHFLNYVLNNPTSLVSISESWYENIAADGESPVWILRTADTAGKSADEIAQIVNDFNEEMQAKQHDGKAMPVRGRLRLDVNATKGQKAEHVVEVQRAGHTYQLYINGNPKAAQALNGTAAKAVSRISDTWLGKKITSLNRSMAAYFTSKNPAFVISNLSRDLNMAGASVAINEGTEYNARFIANVGKVLRPRMGKSSKWVPASKQPTGMMPSLMRKWRTNTLDESNDTERLFKEFMDEGGETGFVNMLSVDSFKEKMKKEIAQMNGSAMFGKGVKETTVHKGLRLLGDTFEFYNRCAEDATRFIVYMTSRQMGKTLEESIADAKDVTLNFNRKGTGGMGNAELRDLFIFVNPAIQALANMVRMAKGRPVKFGAVTAAFVAGGVLMPIINQWLLNLMGDDDDKEAYWNLPPWVRKNNLVFWVPGTKNFVTIPLAQEFRVFYGVGEMISSAVMDHPVNKWGLEIFSSVADLVPINPTGNGGNLMVDFAPTGVQPLMQVGENVDFTGKPIWKENQGNEYAPMYTKAYISTPTWMVKLSEGLNDVTGGNEGKKGAVERNMPFWGNYVNNPAVWNHLLQGYFGGMYNTIAKTFDVGVTAAKGEMPKIYQTPVINRFLNRPVERDNAGVLGEEYYQLTRQRDALMYELRTWQKKAADESAATEPQPTVNTAQAHVDEILSSDEWKRAEIITHYEKILKDLKAGEKAATESADKADIKRSISLYKQQMMEELEALSKGKEPLDAAMDQYDKAKSFSERNKLRMRIEKLMLRQAGADSKKPKARTEDVEKALAYMRGEETESRNVTERYLELATAEDIRNDARIRAARASIKEKTDEYKRLLANGKQAEARKFLEKNQKYFAADAVIQQQSRMMATNKKLLGKGYDASIMRLIANSRNTMLRATDKLE